MMWRRQNRKRADRERTVHRPIDWSRIAVCGTLIILGGGYAGATWLLNRPIDTVVLNGTFQRVSAIQLEALLDSTARVGFLKVDLAGIRREVIALPWVALADVRRKWPSTLEVNITEERPVACWGERGLLNPAGDLFIRAADHVPVELPRLNGPPGTERQVTARFFRVQEQLEHRGNSALAMTLDNRGSWTFRLSNGMEVRLGAQGVDERIARFFQALDTTVGPMSSEVEYVDMRYPNGFAVGWKTHGSVQAAATETEKPNA